MDTDRDYSASAITPQPDPLPTPRAAVLPLPVEAGPVTAPTRPDNRPVRSSRLLPYSFGRYQLLREIAAGGMGVVYEALDPALDRVVALKMIRSGLLAGPEEIARFETEARAAAQLAHPNIVPVHDWGEIEGQHYFTMAFAAGGCLTQHLKEYAADPQAAVALMEKVARAVACAHARGILHRDLKPGNVLLDDRGEPLVSDFGLAKFLDSSLDLTHTGQRIGTPAYMAPEQASGNPRAISAATDVWALGVMLYQLLTGQRPFGAPNVQELTHQILSTEPISPRSLCGNIDRALDTVVLKCLEKNPLRRYPNATALADDLARWQRGEPVQSKPISLPRRVWRSLRRTPLATTTLAGFGFVFVCLTALWAADPERPRETAEQQLAGGAVVTLVGEQGPPAWMRWALGGLHEASKAKDKVFEIQSFDRGLLELLRRPPKQGYRIKAELCHLAGRHQGRVGIYVGYSQRVAADGSVVNCMLAVAVGDQLSPDEIDARRFAFWADRLGVSVCEVRGVGLEAVHWVLTDKAELAQINYTFTKGIYRPNPGLGLGPTTSEPPWRKIELEVTPDVVTGSLDGKELGRMTRAEFLKLTRMPAVLGNDRPWAVQADYLPTQPLGLIVDQAKVRVKNVVVEPLAP